MSSTRQITIRWPIAGAFFGALGWCIAAVFILGPIINGDEIPRYWKFYFAFCPALLMPWGEWWPLVLNCVLYALVFTTLRLTWIRLRSKA
jgi:hypothetical protein